MSDFHFLDLYAKFAGFRIMVLANRLACDDAYSRAAHDTLIGKLDQLIALARRTIAAQRELALNRNGPEAEDLGEAVWYAEQQLIDCWYEPDGIDLLRCHVYVDWATHEWCDVRTGEWRFLNGFPPPRFEVGDDRLNGLCAILRQITDETGIVFNTYTTDPAFADDEADEADLEPESDEELHGTDW